MATNQSDSQSPRRPLLGGGEKLRQDAEWKRGFRKSEPLYTAYERYSDLHPQAEHVLAQLQEMPDPYRADHVVIEATLLPSYLASSYYPQDLLLAHGVYHVGTKQAIARRRTPTREIEEAPTKTLLLAGPDEAVISLLSAFTHEPASEYDPQWEETARFARIGLADPQKVIRSLPADFGDGEVFTWEAVLTSFLGGTERGGEIDEQAFARFAELVKANYGTVENRFRRQLGRSVFVPIVSTVEGVQRIANFNVLRAIRPMPSIRGLEEEDGFHLSESPAPPTS